MQAPAAVLDDAAIRAMEAVCQCEAPIPQYVNALYTAGQSCMNIGRDVYDEAKCVATELGFLNDDGEFLEVTPADLFTAAHGGSEAMDNALDSCYSNAFDNVEDVVMASMTFGTCMEYAVANVSDRFSRLCLSPFFEVIKRKESGINIDFRTNLIWDYFN